MNEEKHIEFLIKNGWKETIEETGQSFWKNELLGFTGEYLDNAVHYTVKHIRRETLKEKFRPEIEKYDNNELLEECFALARGDDYEGMFTEEGYAKYYVMREELDKRLIKFKL